jgi:hypothetical protein
MGIFGTLHNWVENISQHEIVFVSRKRRAIASKSKRSKGINRD